MIVRRLPPAHHQKEVSGQHGEATGVQRRHQPGGERQTDETLIHGRFKDQCVRAATRPASSCCDMADVGLLMKVEVPSAR